MDLLTFASICLVVLLLIGGVVIYIARTTAIQSNKALTLYLDWVERLDLPPLSVKKRSAKENAKILAKNLKIVWNKRAIEEIDLRHDIENLTQKDALGFVLQADELYLTPKTGRRKDSESNRGFAYDIQDAREGNLRLLAVEKNSELYRNFAFGQALIKLIRDVTPLNEFPEIALGDGVSGDSLAGLESFVIANSSMDISPNVVTAVTNSLSQRFSGEWTAMLISEDVVKFARKEEEPEIVPAPREASPFFEQKESKMLAAKEAQAALEAAEESRKAKWAAAEDRKREAEIERRRQAIADGEISPLAEKPRAFLSQAIELAVDKSGLLSVDDEIEIKKSDRIGTPIMFTVFSSELITDEEKEGIFTESVLAALKDNFGGNWLIEYDQTPASTITFHKEIA